MKPLKVFEVLFTRFWLNFSDRNPLTTFNWFLISKQMFVYQIFKTLNYFYKLKGHGVIMLMLNLNVCLFSISVFVIN